MAPEYTPARKRVHEKTSLVWALSTSPLVSATSKTSSRSAASPSRTKPFGIGVRPSVSLTHGDSDGGLGLSAIRGIWTSCSSRFAASVSTSGAPSTQTAMSSTSCSSAAGIATPQRGSFARCSAQRPGPMSHRHRSPRELPAAHRIVMSSASTTLRATPITAPKSHISRRADARTRCGASNRWRMLNGSSRSTASSATSSPSDDIGFAPAISDSCVRGRSSCGTLSLRLDPFGAQRPRGQRVPQRVLT